MKEIVQRLVQVRLPHYVFAGGVTLAIEYSSFLIGFYVIGLPGVTANTLSFVVSITANFLLNKLWVFRPHASRHTWQRQATLFTVLALLNVSVTNIGLYYLLRLDVPAFLVKLFFICLVASWNFITYKKLIFAKADPMGKP